MTMEMLERVKYEEGREEGRILTVRIFQEAKANPGFTEFVYII